VPRCKCWSASNTTAASLHPGYIWRQMRCLSSRAYRARNCPNQHNGRADSPSSRHCSKAAVVQSSNSRSWAQRPSGKRVRFANPASTKKRSNRSKDLPQPFGIEIYAGLLLVRPFQSVSKQIALLVDARRLAPSTTVSDEPWPRSVRLDNGFCLPPPIRVRQPIPKA